MPHVKARDYGSLGFGYAYAYAQDQVCRFADIVATVDAQPLAPLRRRTGATATRAGGRATSPPTSSTSASRTRGSSSGWSAAARRTGRARTCGRPCAASSPAGTRTCGARASTGCPTRAAAARSGSGRSSRSTSTGASTSSGCARRAARCSRRMVNAAPPGATTAAGADRPLGDLGGMGSNGLAVGADGARDARALLLSNTHFPSGTDVRWYELHLTIPGKLDAIGAALQGVPVVNVGFNRHIAWTHTVSTARRFAAYELKLAPGRPTAYVVDGKHGADAQAHGARRRALAHVLRDALGAGRRAARRHADLDGRDRVRAGGPERRQLPPHQPVGGVEPRALGRRVAPQGGALPGQPVGELDRRRRPRATPTTATTARSRT